MPETTTGARMSAPHQDACAHIWQAWQNGTTIDDLPADLKPGTRAAGYAIQAHFEGYSAETRAGWKIAATSRAGQRHINVDGPLAGRLLAENLRPDGTEISINANRMRVAEPEFAFRFAQKVPAKPDLYTVEEVLGFVGDLHLTLELPDSRFTDFTAVGGPTLIADNACARELVVGPKVTANWRALDLAAHRVRARVGARYDREGLGANVLGDPREALTWCVNELSQLGIDLGAGELITTGTCAPPLESEPGDVVESDVGQLGTITAWITT